MVLVLEQSSDVFSKRSSDDFDLALDVPEFSDDDETSSNISVGQKAMEHCTPPSTRGELASSLGGQDVCEPSHIASAQRWRCEYEILPSDGEVQASYLFTRLQEQATPGVVWLGFRTELLFYGIHKLLAICRVNGAARTDDVLQSIEALPEAQSARVLSMSEVGTDSFELCSHLFIEQGRSLDDIGFQSCTAMHVRNLRQQGYTVIDGFLTKSVADAVASLVGDSLANYPDFAHDGIDWRLPEPRNSRSDVAVWLTPGQRPASDAVFSGEVVPSFKRLQNDLGQILSLQGRAEQQLAWYPSASSGYKPHTDAMPDDCPSSDQRKVTAIAYCNPSWAPEDGGALRLWLPDHLGAKSIDVEPISGRLLLFLSGCMRHEVRPSYGKRCAITCWFF